MNITEIRVKLVPNGAERLKAFCSITLDGDFVVRDLKVIDGVNGLFVAMPSRKLCDRCPRCGSKNHLRSRHCNECGASLSESRAPRDEMGRAKLHADIAHPINAACREGLQKRVIQAYRDELERSRQPGYQPPAYDEEESLADGDAGLVGAVTGLDAGSCEPAGPPEGQEEGYDSLIAGLSRDSKAGHGDRGRQEKDRGPRRPGRGPGPAPPRPQVQPVESSGGSRGSTLDDFLSKLGTSGGGSGGGSRRRSGRRGSGGARRSEKPARQPEPARETAPEHTAAPPPPPAAEPEPMPGAPPQPVEPEAEAEDDDFGAGIL